eukprot:4744974-Pyramimonas_sp.AAC.1
MNTRFRTNRRCLCGRAGVLDVLGAQAVDGVRRAGARLHALWVGGRLLQGVMRTQGPQQPRQPAALWCAASARKHTHMKE